MVTSLKNDLKSGPLAMNPPAIVSPQEWEDSPEGYPQTPSYKWWNWHDEYAAASPRLEVG